ncbi:uncharacterized protein [Glycine max]|uniref:uncharacterized protein isoform X6 n=1 Tax=Glycine max TaxID=3847 RepID=UPI001B357DE2|nr:uncharacterized protein LOC100811594 isoform X6 [Glycine max]
MRHAKNLFNHPSPFSSLVEAHLGGCASPHHSQLVSMEEGKETKGKLTTEPKIQRTSEEERDRLILLGWLQVFTNVKILTLSYGTLKLILKDLSNLATMGSQPPCFVRLESLKFVTNQFRVISDEEVNKAVEYLLQNSPLIRVLLSKKLYRGCLLKYLEPVLVGLANHNRSQIGPSLEWDHNHQHHKGGL